MTQVKRDLESGRTIKMSPPEIKIAPTHGGRRPGAGRVNAANRCRRRWEAGSRTSPAASRVASPWMLTALEIPYQLVAPQTWQRAMHAGTPGSDTKQRSILAAQRLFPSVDLRRNRKGRRPDDGLADAL